MFVINFNQGWSDLRETVKGGSTPSICIIVFYGTISQNELNSATAYADIIRTCVCDNYDTNKCKENVCGFDSDYNWDDWIERFLSIIRKTHKEVNVEIHNEELP